MPHWIDAKHLRPGDMILKGDSYVKTRTVEALPDRTTIEAEDEAWEVGSESPIKIADRR